MDGRDGLSSSAQRAPGSEGSLNVISDRSASIGRTPHYPPEPLTSPRPGDPSLPGALWAEDDNPSLPSIPLTPNPYVPHHSSLAYRLPQQRPPRQRDQEDDKDADDRQQD